MLLNCHIGRFVLVSLCVGDLVQFGLSSARVAGKFMCVCMCVYVCVCMCVYVCVFMCLCECMWVCVFMCV